MKKKARKYDPINITIVGCGGMARHHLSIMLAEFEDTHIPVVCEPNMQQYEATAAKFEAAGRVPPKNEPDLSKLLEEYGADLDAAFIITPHVLHHDQALACLEVGLDVLLEKPMVMNVAEAKSLIEARDRLNRLLVVAFNGSLSPEIRTASADTGAHMLNTTADLAGQGFVDVAAWLDNRNTAVDIVGTVIARLESGALVTMHGSGDTVPTCASDILVFCSGAILRTGAWGKRLELLRYGEHEFKPVAVPPTTGAWEQFLSVRQGELTNPSPPEAGLRMAYLWDAIRESAAKNGIPVSLDYSI